MNKKHLFGFFVVAILTLSACNRNSPKEVAKTWLIAFNSMDIDPALKISTPPTKNLLSTLYQLTGGITDSARKELNKVDVDIVDVKQNEYDAIVTYTTSDNPRERKIKLVRQSDKWLVQFTKEDLANEVVDIPNEPLDDAAPAADSAAAFSINKEAPAKQ